MSEINHFKFFLLCKMMWQMMLEGADVACVDWLLMCHTCMCRELH